MELIKQTFAVTFTHPSTDVKMTEQELLEIIQDKLRAVDWDITVKQCD
jgi:hypothetical protein